MGSRPIPFGFKLRPEWPRTGPILFDQIWGPNGLPKQPRTLPGPSLAQQRLTPIGQRFLTRPPIAMHAWPACHLRPTCKILLLHAYSLFLTISLLALTKQKIENETILQKIDWQLWRWKPGHRLTCNNYHRKWKQKTWMMVTRFQKLQRWLKEQRRLQLRMEAQSGGNVCASLAHLQPMPASS